MPVKRFGLLGRPESTRATRFTASSKQKRTNFLQPQRSKSPALSFATCHSSAKRSVDEVFCDKCSHSQDDLRAVFAKYGPLNEVTIVRDEKTGKMRGFAFIGFMGVIDAGAALKAANASEIKGRWESPDYMHAY